MLLAHFGGLRTHSEFNYSSIFVHFYNDNLMTKPSGDCRKFAFFHLEAEYFWHIRIHLINNIISYEISSVTQRDNFSIKNLNKLNKLRIQNSQFRTEL